VNCFIAVPTAFTPNADGLNDYLYPLNALKADNLEFRVYNRYGQQVFYTNDWTRKWDGRIGGREQPAGVYAWLLSYTHQDTGEKIFRRGTTVLIR
jgi:gliding motility-associated-like protein